MKAPEIATRCRLALAELEAASVLLEGARLQAVRGLSVDAERAAVDAAPRIMAALNILADPRPPISVVEHSERPVPVPFLGRVS